MKIEMWLDIVCPWCYIGKRSLESALAHFEYRDQVELHLRSYELAPENSRVPLGLVDNMTRTIGISPQQATQRLVQVTTRAAEVGLDYHLENAKLVNSFDAHRLIHLAAKQELQGAMEERLMQAFTMEGLVLTDHDTLIRLASEVGLDIEVVQSTLKSNAYSDNVRSDERRAYAFGITGVPYLVIDEKYGVSGGQSPEVFLHMLEYVWSQSHSLIRVEATSQQTGTCSNEGCDLQG